MSAHNPNSPAQQPAGSPAHSAIARAGDSPALSAIVEKLVPELAPGEDILEVADTSARRKHGALLVTTKRVLLADESEKVSSVELSSLTGHQVITQPELTLRLRTFDAHIDFPGMGPQGLQRIEHALNWLRASDEQRSGWLVRPSNEELVSTWGAAQDKKQALAESLYPEAQTN